MCAQAAALCAQAAALCAQAATLCALCQVALLSCGATHVTLSSVVSAVSIASTAWEHTGKYRKHMGK